jgi:hypothetical protein
MTDKRRTRHSPNDGSERRTSPRRPASSVPNLKARLLAGAEVRLVDISRRGVLLETDTRLLPGSPIRIKFVADDANLVLKGCVVRSSVNVVSGEGLVYRTAVAFDEDIALCDASLWEETPASEPGHEPVSLTLVADRPAEPETTVTTLFASSSDDLIALLAANDW